MVGKAGVMVMWHVLLPNLKAALHVRPGQVNIPSFAINCGKIEIAPTAVKN